MAATPGDTVHVGSAILGADGKTVTVSTWDGMGNLPYEMAVTGVEDLHGNTISEPVTHNFTGSDANDTIVRLVRHFWNLAGKPDKKTFISRDKAYHGSTVAGASLGRMKPMHKQGGLPSPEIEHITQP